MQVTIIDGPLSPARTVCKAARNDYYDGWVVEDSFSEIMETVDPKKQDIEFADTHLELSEESPRSDVVDDLADDLSDDGSHSVHEIVAKQHRLMRKLMSDRHFGPWEHVQVTFGIKGISRSCMAQLTRHRHATFDVQSMRYVDFSDLADDALIPASVDRDSVVAREKGLVDLDQGTRDELREQYRAVVENAAEFYENAVEAGMPKEDARFALPIGTPVNVVMSANLRSLMHVLSLRGAGDAQWEIRDLSTQLEEQLRTYAPITMDCFDDQNFANAP